MRVVAVFGGGGAKAVAHLGAERALVEASLVPGHYVGTSFGAIIGAALASGLSPDVVRRAAHQLTRRDVARLDLVAVLKGLFSEAILKPGPLRDTIRRLVPVGRFAELRTPLTVTATDVDSGELVLFGAGGRTDVSLVDALYASCALPVYYPPAHLDGHRYADGGLRATLPLQVARSLPADLVVAVDVGPGFDEAAAETRTPAFPPPLVRAQGEALRVMMAAQTADAIAAWPPGAARLLVVRAVAERQATFAVDRQERYYEAGYRKTKEALANL